MADPVQFDGLTKASEPADQVLEKAKRWIMEDCIIIGFGHDGALKFGGNISDKAQIVYLLELGKHFILTGEAPDYD